MAKLGRAPASSKVERVVKTVVHAVAAGRWAEGHRLPSVREGERLWGVSRLTVLKAYRTLVGMHLVYNKPRSGFFVAAGPSVERAAFHRAELDRIYEAVDERIRGETRLSPLGVLRYLAQRAEISALERPECVFVECTRFQAETHAKEIRDRLGVPCMAMTTAQFDGNPRRVPVHVRALVTTAFHRAEVDALASPPHAVAVEVPIRFSREQWGRMVDDGRPILLLGINAETVRQVSAELTERSGESGASISSSEVSKDQLSDTLSRLLPEREFGGDRPFVLLSPTLWEAATPAWRQHECVLPMLYELGDEAWARVADALGLPFGALS